MHPPPTPLENVIDDGLMAIQRANFLKKAGVESLLDDEFLLNPPSRGDLLESAIRNMIRYVITSFFSNIFFFSSSTIFISVVVESLGARGGRDRNER